MNKPLELAVIFGGKSCEHEGSIENSICVIQALKQDPMKYKVFSIYVSKTGTWFLLDASLNLNQGTLLFDPNQEIKSEEKDSLLELLISMDIIFPLIQGPNGEDGCLPGFLELIGKPYIGSGVLASSLGMDKILFKQVLEQNGLPTAPFIATTRDEWKKNKKLVKEKCEQNLHYPLFVKPANMGSSIGIKKIYSSVDFEEALDHASLFDTRLLIEEGVLEPRELEVAIIGNHEPHVSIIGELRHSRDFFSYEAKYLDNDTKLILPADLPLDLQNKIKEMALKVYSTLNCAGFARLDFLLSATSNSIFISEINTVPGLREDRMFPELWKKMGFTYIEIIDQLIQLGFENHHYKQVKVI